MSVDTDDPFDGIGDRFDDVDGLSDDVDGLSVDIDDQRGGMDKRPATSPVGQARSMRGSTQATNGLA